MRTRWRSEPELTRGHKEVSSLEKEVAERNELVQKLLGWGMRQYHGIKISSTQVVHEARAQKHQVVQEAKAQRRQGQRQRVQRGPQRGLEAAAQRRRASGKNNQTDRAQSVQRRRRQQNSQRSQRQARHQQRRLRQRSQAGTQRKRRHQQ